MSGLDRPHSPSFRHSFLWSRTSGSKRKLKPKIKCEEKAIVRNLWRILPGSHVASANIPLSTLLSSHDRWPLMSWSVDRYSTCNCRSERDVIVAHSFIPPTIPAANIVLAAVRMKMISYIFCTFRTYLIESSQNSTIAGTQNSFCVENSLNEICP